MNVVDHFIELNDMSNISAATAADSPYYLPSDEYSTPYQNRPDAMSMMCPPFRPPPPPQPSARADPGVHFTVGPSLPSPPAAAQSRAPAAAAARYGGGACAMAIHKPKKTRQPREVRIGLLIVHSFPNYRGRGYDLKLSTPSDFSTSSWR